jgi:hypothetical protein
MVVYVEGTWGRMYIYRFVSQYALMEKDRRHGEQRGSGRRCNERAALHERAALQPPK